MTNVIGYAGPPAATFGSLGHEPVRVNPDEVAAARRMIVKHVPIEDEIEVRRMLGVHHD